MSSSVELVGDGKQDFLVDKGEEKIEHCFNWSNMSYQEEDGSGLLWLLEVQFKGVSINCFKYGL